MWLCKMITINSDKAQIAKLLNKKVECLPCITWMPCVLKRSWRQHSSVVSEARVPQQWSRVSAPEQVSVWGCSQFVSLLPFNAVPWCFNTESSICRKLSTSDGSTPVLIKTNHNSQMKRITKKHFTNTNAWLLSNVEHVFSWMWYQEWLFL